jgi:hypothetical protein
MEIVESHPLARSMTVAAGNVKVNARRVWTLRVRREGGSCPRQFAPSTTDVLLGELTPLLGSDANRADPSRNRP